MVNFNLSLQDKDILLRPIKNDDFESFKILSNDKELWSYFTSDLSDRKALQSWLNDAIEQRRIKTRLAFTIFNKLENKIIGSSSFGNISQGNKCIEIGWTWLAKNYHGKGINRKIKHLMIQYVFEGLHFERVEFKTDVLNTAARKALTKIGAIEEGVLRSHTLMTGNRRRDTIYYSILKSEWTALKKKNEWK